MIDIITYEKVDGAVVKTVVSEQGIVDKEMPNEIAAVTAMVKNLIAGNESEPTPEATSAIANYEEQLSILKEL